MSAFKKDIKASDRNKPALTRQILKREHNGLANQ
jgi:hypothetical protein